VIITFSIRAVLHGVSYLTILSRSSPKFGYI